MDLDSFAKWWEYTGAIDKMIAATDTEHVHWYIVRADSKKRGRLNCIEHLTRQIPYKKVKFTEPSFQAEQEAKGSSGRADVPKHR